MKSTPEQHAAYRVGLCIDCRDVRYSAGRPRCNACHAAYEATLSALPVQVGQSIPVITWQEFLGALEGT